MIFLDGSSFFFDIEGCFSNLVESARKENYGIEADSSAKNLCSGFAKYYGLNPDFVSSGADYSTVLKAIFEHGEKVLVPELDESTEFFEQTFGENPAFSFPKSADMKLKIADLAQFANENGVSSIYFTNPCSPTSLMLSPDEILSLSASVQAKIIVDESHITDGACSCMKLAGKTENLVVLKKIRFAKEPVFAVGKNIPEHDCKISSAEQAVGSVIFEHCSAIRTAEKKLFENTESLYIRIKKLAVKFDGMERLFRTKADCIFFKVKNADEIAGKLFENGVKIRRYGDYLCVFSESKEENEEFLIKLEALL